jgi:predicted AAA+ superfamily ATPase
MDAPIRRLVAPGTQHMFLLGPRGTGKTTWLRTVFSDAVFVDLLEPGTYRDLLSAPERLELLVDAVAGRVVVVDEVQRAPGLLPVVHRLIDRGAAARFILTGSSARKLRRGDVDLLGGRATPRVMHPFMAAETATVFDLDRALALGMLPLVWGSSDPPAVLKGYVGIYLEQEVKAEAAVRRIESFARFLEALSFSQASLLNLSEISRECQVRRSTVGGYLEIAQDLLIARTLPAFSRRARRATTSHPKFFFFDCGVYRSLRPKGPLDRPAEIDGAALETLVYQHLQAWVDNGTHDCRLHYWRTPRGLEVDLVAYGADTFIALEVKNSARVRPQDLRGLRAFSADFPECTPVLLYRGKERLKQHGVLCIPVADFLPRLSPDTPLAGALEP